MRGSEESEQLCPDVFRVLHVFCVWDVEDMKDVKTLYFVFSRCRVRHRGRKNSEVENPKYCGENPLQIWITAERSTP